MPQVNGHPAGNGRFPLAYAVADDGEHFISQVSLTKFFKHLAGEFEHQADRLRDGDGDPVVIAGVVASQMLADSLAESLTLFALDDFKEPRRWTRKHSTP